MQRPERVGTKKQPDGKGLLAVFLQNPEDLKWWWRLESNQ